MLDVLEDRASGDTLVELLQSLHHEMMVSADRVALLESLNRLALDEETQGPARFLALILLGGWRSASPSVGLELLHHADERLVLAAVLSAIMNPVVPLEKSPTGALVDSNGKAQAAFWIDVLQRTGGLYDGRFRPSSDANNGLNLSTGLVFWNCLGVLDSNEFQDRARDIVRRGSNERIRGTLFSLLAKEETRVPNVDLACELVMDPGAPRSLRDTGVIVMTSTRPPGWADQLLGVMATDSDSELCQWIFALLRGKAPEAVAAFVTNGNYMTYLQKLRQSNPAGIEIAKFYSDVVSMEIDNAPRLGIQILNQEGDASVKVRTASLLSYPSPVERVTDARVQVLRALCEDPDSRVTESAALGLARQATSEGYPGSTAERLGLLEYAERVLTATLAGLREGSPERSRYEDELRQVSGARRRLSGK